MRVLKIQSKNLLNVKIVVNYLNLVFRIDVKTKSKYKIFNFVFQFIKNTKLHVRYTNSQTTKQFSEQIKSIFCNKRIKLSTAFDFTAKK